MKNQTVTDCDKNLNSKSQFRIQIDGSWYDVEAKDFFDYLWETDRISGHDSEKGMAWVETIDYEYNPHTDTGRDVKKGTCNTYQWWIKHLISDDEVLLQYMQTIEIVTAQAA